MKNSSVSKNFNSPIAIKLRGLLEKSPKTGEKTSYKILAEYLSVRIQSVSSWANGTTIPDTKHIAPIAKYFGVSCDYFLGESKAPTEDKDAQMVCDEIGLSVKAFENLKFLLSVDGTNRHITNTLLENNGLIDLTGQIAQTVGFMNDDAKSNPDESVKVNGVMIPRKAFLSTSFIDVSRFWCSRISEKLIDDVIELKIKKDGANNEKI